MPKDLLKWTAAGFALAATATAEYEIAREIGMNQWIAAAVPGALDAYVVRALRTHREVLTSVVAMVGVNAASHLVTAGILPVEWPLITAVSAIAPLVLWRVHALGTPGQWRARKLWDLSTDEHDAVLASTEPEHTGHGRAPDNPEPPGTREHPEHTASTLFPRVPGGEHIACTECGVMFPGVPDLEAHQRDAEHGVLGRVHAASTLDGPASLIEHTASTDQERVRAQTDAWGDDWLDVADAVNPPSTPPVPVHAPYVDHVHVEQTDPEPVLLPFRPSTQPVKARHLKVVKEHAPDPGELDDRDGVTGYVDETEHTASTRTAEDWNLEHVSTGVLEPDDTVHMERARELFHTIGSVPPFRALKEGTPGMGTPRAQRIRAALKIEAEGTD